MEKLQKQPSAENPKFYLHVYIYIISFCWRVAESDKDKDTAECTNYLSCEERGDYTAPQSYYSTYDRLMTQNSSTR